MILRTFSKYLKSYEVMRLFIGDLKSRFSDFFVLLAQLKEPICAMLNSMGP